MRRHMEVDSAQVEGLRFAKSRDTPSTLTVGKKGSLRVWGGWGWLW